MRPTVRSTAPSGERIDHVLVFRALMLGDLLCTVPALRALRAGLPHASITLVGLPWAQALVQRLRCVDEFVAFTGHGLPEARGDAGPLQALFPSMRARHIDLAIQLHGSGEATNALVAKFGARHLAGFASAHAWTPPQDAEHFLRWPGEGNEIERLLALTDHLGFARRGTHLEFPLTDSDRTSLARVWPCAANGAAYVCVHAGAQLESRRWGAQRFARVADAIAADGRIIVLTGTADETGLVAQVAQHMRAPAVNLCGKTSLWTLGVLVEHAAGVVCNDTGISHIAAALRTPSVVVSCGADSHRWAPLDRHRHRVLAHPLACRPCSFAECPIGQPCASAITPEEVVQCYSRGIGSPKDGRAAARDFPPVIPPRR